MANKQISDLQARTFDGDSIIAHDVENTDPSTMSQKPYLTGSATGHAVADFVGNGEIYTSDLNTVDKHINGAINELHTINGYSYDAYDDTATYSVGDLCIYNNTLYKCTTAITTAEAWNASHWTATSIADEINELKSGLDNEIPIILSSTGNDKLDRRYSENIAKIGNMICGTAFFRRDGSKGNIGANEVIFSISHTDNIELLNSTGVYILSTNGLTYVIAKNKANDNKVIEFTSDSTISDTQLHMMNFAFGIKAN